MKKGLSALWLVLVIVALLSSCDLILGAGTTTTTTVQAQGSISGMVKDAVSGLAIEGVSVTLAAGGGIAGSTVTDANGAFAISAEGSSALYSATFSKSGYLQATYRGIAIASGQTTYLETLLQINAAYTGTGTATGSISNAYDHEAVADATLSFREGVNTMSGSVIDTTTTDANGAYSITTSDLGGPGNYTAEVAKSGFTTMYFTVALAAGNTIDEQNASISPTIAADDYRIVLDWGASPYDLDSHLTGPTGQGAERFHIYFSNGSYPDADNPEVALDTDDTDSYGPETVTIYSKKSGEYHYYVHDYSNRDASAASPSTTLAASGARVRVYYGGSLVATYHAPTGRQGNCWDVFTLDGAALTPVNTVSYISDWNEGRALREANIFKGLPAKR